jgi:micrococcal nuclease
MRLKAWPLKALRHTSGFILLALFSLHGVAAPVKERVIGVLDGDTISLIDHDHRVFESASLKWMPPEKHQPFDAASKQSLASLVFGQDVLNNVVAIARSRLSLGKILIGEFDINLVMVRRVMAWVCERYAPERNYLGVQIEAQSEGQELWKG